MRRDHVQLESRAMGGAGDVIVYGHFGRPVLIFPPRQGRAWDPESGGLLDALRPLVDGGRAKLYCVDSNDAPSWSDRLIPFADVARRLSAYDSWILEHVVPFIYADCGGPLEIVATGCDAGALQAVNLALRRVDLFPTAICVSGRYDLADPADAGDAGDAAAQGSPVDYVARLDGEPLEWLLSRLLLILVNGPGDGGDRADAAAALDSARRLAEMLAKKGIKHELDIWGEDGSDDWPTWREQLARHLSRYC